MTLTEQIYAQAVLLSGTDDEAQEQLLRILCQAAAVGLSARLRDGITVDDCKADFVAAASLYALAALSETDELKALETIQIGDVSMKRGGGTAAARCLRTQAELMMSAYLKDSFSFRGV